MKGSQIVSFSRKHKELYDDGIAALCMGVFHLQTMHQRKEEEEEEEEEEGEGDREWRGAGWHAPCCTQRGRMD